MVTRIERNINKLSFLVEVIQSGDYELAARFLQASNDEWLDLMYENLRMAVDMIYSEERKRGYQPS